METKNIYQKLLQCQMEIGAITKTQDNPFFHSKYADINAILAVVKPILNSHGLVLTQTVKMGFKPEDDSGSLGIQTWITDVDSKEHIGGFCEIPKMPDPQKTGSAITYFRRYALQSLLALEAQDDDGNVASQPSKATPKKTSTATNNEHTDKFLQDMIIEPTEEEIVKWQEHIDMSRDVRELAQIWKEMPVHVKVKLEKYKNERKFNLT